LKQEGTEKELRKEWEKNLTRRNHPIKKQKEPKREFLELRGGPETHTKKMYVERSLEVIALEGGGEGNG